nr:4987_t:CDS:10 [Entrophospora candida]
MGNTIPSILIRSARDTDNNKCIDLFALAMTVYRKTFRNRNQCVHHRMSKPTDGKFFSMNSKPKVLNKEQTNEKGWGTNKKEYYDAEELSDLDEAKEEEKEVLRLQKMRISKMTEADFFDDDDNLKFINEIKHEDKEDDGNGSNENNEDDDDDDDSVDDSVDDDSVDDSVDNDSVDDDSVYDDDDDDNGVEIEVMKERYANLPKSDIIKLLENQSPELIKLLNEFKEKLSIINESTRPIIDKAKQKRIVDNPIMEFLFIKHQTLLNYLTNISFYLYLKSSGTSINLFEHPITDTLLELNNTWKKLEKLEIKMKKSIDLFIEKLNDDNVDVIDWQIESNIIEHENQSFQEENDDEINSENENNKYYEEELLENNSSDLDNSKPSSSPKLTPTILTSVVENEFESTDFGDLDVLDEVDAEDKIQRKKSLRYHVSKIDQKLAKREKAIKLSGDTKKVEKKLQYNQQKEENKIVSYEDDTLPNGTKRKINYQIYKNKGLMPHRKKEQRNPRVKHRNKYVKAKKKIKSIKPGVIKQKGFYGGESTGINAGISRSVRYSNIPSKVVMDFGSDEEFFQPVKKYNPSKKSPLSSTRSSKNHAETEFNNNDDERKSVISQTQLLQESTKSHSVLIRNETFSTIDIVDHKNMLPITTNASVNNGLQKLKISGDDQTVSSTVTTAAAVIVTITANATTATTNISPTDNHISLPDKRKANDDVDQEENFTSLPIDVPGVEKRKKMEHSNESETLPKLTKRPRIDKKSNDKNSFAGTEIIWLSKAKVCPYCDKKWACKTDNVKNRIAHMKRCGKKLKISPADMVTIVREKKIIDYFADSDFEDFKIVSRPIKKLVDPNKNKKQNGKQMMAYDLNTTPILPPNDAIKRSNRLAKKSFLSKPSITEFTKYLPSSPSLAESNKSKIGEHFKMIMEERPKSHKRNYTLWQIQAFGGEDCPLTINDYYIDSVKKVYADFEFDIVPNQKQKIL